MLLINHKVNAFFYVFVTYILSATIASSTDTLGSLEPASTSKAMVTAQTLDKLPKDCLHSIVKFIRKHKHLRLVNKKFKEMVDKFDSESSVFRKELTLKIPRPLIDASLSGTLEDKDERLTYLLPLKTLLARTNPLMININMIHLNKDEEVTILSCPSAIELCICHVNVDWISSLSPDLQSLTLLSFYADFEITDRGVVEFRSNLTLRNLDFSRLIKLKTLDIRTNRDPQNLAFDMSKLPTGLECFYLSVDKKPMTGGVTFILSNPEELEKLKRLRVLSIPGNELATIAIFHDLSVLCPDHLETINISSCLLLSDFSPLSHMPKLREVTVSKYRPIPELPKTITILRQ